MNARIGLIWVVAVVAVDSALAWVFHFLRRDIFEQIDARPEGVFDETRTSLYERLTELSKVSTYSELALSVLTLAGVGVLAAALRGQKRSLAWIGFAVLALGLALFAVELGHDALDPDAMGATRLLWMATTVTHYGGLVAVLAAAAARLVSPRARVGWTLGYALFAIVLVALSAWQIFGIDHDREQDRALAEALEWPWRILANGSRILFMACLIWSARAGAREERDEAPSRSGEGGPLRLLVWSAFARIALGVLAAGATAVGMAQGASVGGLLVLLVAVSATCGVAMCVAIGRQIGWPELARSGGALVLSLGCLSLALLLDVWVTVNVFELIDLVAEARGATSLWGMPSISRIEELQSIATWGGRVGQALGLVTMVSLLVSLHRTASFLQRDDLRAKSGTALALAIVGGVIGLGTMALAAEASRALLPVLGIGMLAMLGVGVAFLVAFVQLASGLARAMDARSEDAPGARPHEPEPVA